MTAVLCNLKTFLTKENCYNNIDDDGDGLIDKADPDCIRCGDGIVDPGEDCDDGNMLDGDGCSSVRLYLDCGRFLSCCGLYQPARALTCGGAAAAAVPTCIM